ncbi:uncharacterized protein EV154DRAFT_555997 [Mucor mucedo]|uniref:uncharacterized protein n=1 Tax=Mucor mucedo TaxID=29922 RepID=UPI00221E57AF|nr:uncharacterized protein EV154DRAFT_555997 [Mucor mucedo]KAI7874625.1 hypothetical protein EV154DRAFT_555997 [Mucor mucedo]
MPFLRISRFFLLMIGEQFMSYSVYVQVMSFSCAWEILQFKIGSIFAKYVLSVTGVYVGRKIIDTIGFSEKDERPMPRQRHQTETQAKVIQQKKTYSCGYGNA